MLINRNEMAKVAGSCRRGWDFFKIVTGVDLSSKGGFALDGPWLNHNSIALEKGYVVLRGNDGSAKHPRDAIAVIEIRRGKALLLPDEEINAAVARQTAERQAEAANHALYKAAIYLAGRFGVEQ